MISTLRKRLRKNKGFTLIELLVVMIIIGILVAIAIPSYLSLKGRAHKSAAESDLRAFVPDIESFYADHGTYAGMTVTGLKASYDQSINTSGSDPVYVIASSGDTTYCVTVTEANQIAVKKGPDQPILAGTVGGTGLSCA